MDQSEMEQMMERLMAGMEARMMAEMKAIQHKWDAIEHERKAHHEEMRAEMDAWLGGVMHACLEKNQLQRRQRLWQSPGKSPREQRMRRRAEAPRTKLMSSVWP
jgi:hypothetical protein